MKRFCFPKQNFLPVLGTLLCSLTLPALLSASDPSAAKEKTIMKITITSSAFTEGHLISKSHAFDDSNLSPALQWTGVPPEAKASRSSATTLTRRWARGFIGCCTTCRLLLPGFPRVCRIHPS